MMSANPFSFKFTAPALMLALIAAFGMRVCAQQAPAVHVGGTTITGLPDDWTHHHLTFSDPGTEQDAIRNGTHERWLRVVNDPRYVIQRLRQNLPVRGPSAQDVEMRYRIEEQERWMLRRRYPGRWQNDKPPLPSLKNDWAVGMGAGAHGTGGVYPAKYTFSISSAACSDYVVFPTAVTGSATIPNIVAYNNLYNGTSPLNCTTGNPTVFWQVSIENSGGTFATVTTSPVLSYDGTQVAFVATISGTSYLVVMLLPNADAAITSLTCPGTGTNVNNIAQTGAPQAWCSNALSHADTTSSPFWDSIDNVLYVGDSSGNLHKFQNVFAAYGIGGWSANTTAPSELGSPWPVALASTALASPVYDGSTYVFVGSAYTSSGAVLYGVTAATAAKHGTSSSLGHGPGIVDGPLVDGTQGRVYVSIGNDGTSSCSSNGCSKLFQFSTGFTNGTGSSVTVGDGAGSTAAIPMYSGAFNDAYYNSSVGTGELYVCGNTGNGSNANGDPILYGIPISTNTMGGPTAAFTLTNAAATCSPVTEVKNGAHDWIFLGVTAGSKASGDCTAGGGCVYNFDVASGVPSAPTGGLTATSGASGIVIDNVVSNSGASQIYYENLSGTTCTTGTNAGGCAVQTSQSAP